MGLAQQKYYELPGFETLLATSYYLALANVKKVTQHVMNLCEIRICSFLKIVP